MAAKFEIRSSGTGEYNWVLTSQGRTLATGESYTRKASAEKAIDSLRKAAGSATVADLTLAPAKTAPGKAARATGRAVGKAVAKAGAAVEKVEKAAAKATGKATKATKGPRATKAAKATSATASTAKAGGAGGRKATAAKTAAPRKRATKAG